MFIICMCWFKWYDEREEVRILCVPSTALTIKISFLLKMPSLCNICMLKLLQQMKHESFANIFFQMRKSDFFPQNFLLPVQGSFQCGKSLDGEF